MNRALIRKELAAMRPFIFLTFFFASLDWFYISLTSFPDQFPLSELISPDAETEGLISIFVIGLALAAGLLIRERDDGTLDFLDALPVTRTRIFVCKIAVAWAILWMIPLSRLLATLVFHGLSRTSLETETPWLLIVTPPLLGGLMAFVYLALGVALSFLRQFALLALGLLFWARQLLQESDVSWVAYFNLFAVADAAFEGRRWLVPTEVIGAQLAIGAGCLLIGYVAFLVSGDWTARARARLSRIRGASLVGALSVVLAIAVWGGLGVYSAMKDESLLDDPKVAYGDWSVGGATTLHYRFVFPEYRAAELEPLFARADQVHEVVREFVGAEASTPIAVDLTGALPRHAGQAYWKKIRMNVLPPDVMPSVLAHETAHVLIDQASDSRLYQNFNSTRIFHEGLASFIEYHRFLDADSLDALRRVAAVAKARDHVELEELFDDALLRRHRDPDWVYPLGEAFVAALVERYGTNAPAKINAAFARKNAPEGLTGMGLWQDVFQACRFNLSSVVNRFFGLLDEEAAKWAEFVDALPRLKGAVTVGQREVIVRPSSDGDVPGRVVCRFRAAPDTPERFYRETFRDSDGAFRADLSDFPGRSFWYQLGIATPLAAHTLFEPWVEVRK